MWRWQGSRKEEGGGREEWGVAAVRGRREECMAVDRELGLVRSCPMGSSLQPQASHGTRDAGRARKGSPGRK